MAIPKPFKYVADFEQLGLGLFVHWGLYSQMGKGEWIFDNIDMPMSEYMKLKDTFTAEDFDADALCEFALEAGCKYITLTTKHHEGFALYDACGLNNDFDAPHSPAKRDLIREFVDACNRHGLKPFFYHATLDWFKKDEYDNDWDTYLEYIRQSVELLCKNYGKVGGFWFDGNWSRQDADWKCSELYKTIRKYQPEAIIVNNTGMIARGALGDIEIDSVTFEQGTPEPMNRDGMPKYLAAEMCQTINNHWGIGANDINYKSPAELIENLCACRRVGANYLLNIGPTAQGGIAPYHKELFKLIGIWMRHFGEAIYNGRPYSAKCFGKNFILKSVDGKSLYIFVHELDTGGSVDVMVGGKYKGAYGFSGVTDNIKSLKWMDNNEELKFIQGEGMLCFDATGYEYGKSLVVRVAKAEIE